jgi:hypothetical protein
VAIWSSGSNGNGYWCGGTCYGSCGTLYTTAESWANETSTTLYYDPEKYELLQFLKDLVRRYHRELTKAGIEAAQLNHDLIRRAQHNMRPPYKLRAMPRAWDRNLPAIKAMERAEGNKAHMG